MPARAHDMVPLAGEVAPTISRARPLHPVLAWVVCALWHRAAHRWYPRYLDGYGECATCGRSWA